MTKVTPTAGIVEAAHSAYTDTPRIRGLGSTKKLIEAVIISALNHPDAPALFADVFNADSDIQVIENASIDDIQAGDRVIHIQTMNYRGIINIGRREGIAHHLDERGIWCNEEGEWIICETEEDDTITIRRTIDALPTKDGSVIVHLEHEAIRAKDNTKYLNDFHRLTFDEDTQTWYGMDLAGNLRWTTEDDIVPGTWKKEEK